MLCSVPFTRKLQDVDWAVQRLSNHFSEPKTTEYSSYSHDFFKEIDVCLAGDSTFENKLFI